MPAPERRYFVYMVHCSDGTFYTGYTTDVAARIAKHNAGEGAKYTRRRLPVRLVFEEEHPTKSAAMSREHALKQLSRAEKLLLATDPRRP